MQGKRRDGRKSVLVGIFLSWVSGPVCTGVLVVLVGWLRVWLVSLTVLSAATVPLMLLLVEPGSGIVMPAVVL